MNVKTMITGLALSMLLSSGTANADWGDVYYCQMTHQVNITLDGEMTRYKLEKFQFKLDQTKNAMVFGSTGYLQDQVFELTKDWNWPEKEAWYAQDQDQFQTTWFEKGKFMYAQVGGARVAAITADCDKF